MRGGGAWALSRRLVCWSEARGGHCCAANHMRPVLGVFVQQSHANRERACLRAPRWRWRYDEKSTRGVSGRGLLPVLSSGYCRLDRARIYQHFSCVAKRAPEHCTQTTETHPSHPAPSHSALPQLHVQPPRHLLCER